MINDTLMHDVISYENQSQRLSRHDLFQLPGRSSLQAPAIEQMVDGQACMEPQSARCG